MEQSIHIKSTGGLRKDKSKIKAEEKLAVVKAVYLKGFEVLLYFNNGEQRIVNFLPFFSKLSGAYVKYSQLKFFRKFLVENGNIFWGENEDVIFPVSTLYSGNFSKKPKEEILYII
ncbi:MAG: hypothetical protein ABIS69_02655 [Sediminibacterium sp.]